MRWPSFRWDAKKIPGQRINSWNMQVDRTKGEYYCKWGIRIGVQWWNVCEMSQVRLVVSFVFSAGGPIRTRIPMWK